MDSLTQAVLGAAVGEAVLGRRVGRKAAAWGAVAGTLPDLDILINPLLSDVQQLVYHRGISHSIFFAVMLAPVLGWIISRIHRGSPASWRSWAGLAFAALFTHPLLDCFTTYGTQLFQPFSNYPVAFDTIFIIDPLYSVPLAGGLLAALLLHRHPARRRLANTLGLALSSAYLLGTVAVKAHVDAVFAGALHAQGYAYERLSTRPTPLNTLLWTVLADDGDGYWVGLYSLLDGDGPIGFKRLDKNAALLDGLTDDPDVQRLLWFSRGYYTVYQHDGALVFNDIRFGRSDNWLADGGSYIFSFRIQPHPDDARTAAVEQQPISVRFDASDWTPLLKRIAGR